MFAKKLGFNDGAPGDPADKADSAPVVPAGEPEHRDTAPDTVGGQILSLLTADRDRANRWLDWQCQMITGVRRGLVLIGATPAEEAPRPVATWPDAGIPLTTLLDVATQAIRGHGGVAQQYANEEDGLSEVCDYIAYPLTQGDRAIGAVALALTLRSEPQRRAVLQLVQWGAAWLEETLVRDSGRQRGALSVTLDAVDTLSTDAPLPVAGHELCNLIADRVVCSRVALGLCTGLQVHVISMSHQLRFDRRVTRVSQIENAMEECVDQDRILMLPSPDDTTERSPTQAHAQLLAKDGSGSVCSIPLCAGDETRGVLTLIRERGEVFDEDTSELMTTLAATIGPVLELKLDADQSAWGRASRAMADGVRRLLGRGYWRFKSLIALGLLAVAILVWTESDYQITARSTIEGESQQAVVAPFEGYILAAHARAGDQVDANQELATLDDRELLVELEKWSSERDKHAKEYQEALANRDRAQISILSARIAQVEAQLNKVAGQIKRTKVRAPFDGVLVSGDLSRLLGAPVERGQLLFEVVPMTGYRVAMHVDEHDIADLKIGQRGNLRLTGFPEHAIPLKVSRILPVAAVEQGTNRFRVEAEIEHAPAGLRPGMQGVAKVVAGRSSLLWVWTHTLVERLRLWLWSVGV